ncbi:MAG: Trk system potassium transporter TrkA [Clostridia bacterium]|nr:Trk system potassium transporter TrkA [Clostridia bacterium]
MKIIIIGAGKIGRALVEGLSKEDHDVSVIDTNKEVIEELVNTCDVFGICGNGALYSVQEDAGAGEADLVIATTGADEINMMICLLARKLGASHTIARVRDPRYEKQLRFMRDDLGLSMSINPEKATAHEIARVLRFPTALKREAFAKGRVELIEYLIAKGSPLSDVKLSDLSSNIKAKVLICAVEREGKVAIPTGDFVLREGDTVYITSSTAELRKFFGHLGVLRAGVDSVMIAGGSNICYYLANELTETGIDFTIIDKDMARCKHLSEHFPGALVIKGDATEVELLNEEGITRTDGFVALTDIDEANIMISMYAIKMGVGKVVAKINRQSFADLVSRTAMTDTIISPSQVTAEQIIRYVRSMNTSPENGIVTLHRLVGGKVEAVEFNATAESGVTGITLSDLPTRDDTLIAVIVKNGNFIIPGGGDVIEEGDSVVVVTTDTALTSLSQIVRKGGVKK